MLERLSPPTLTQKEIKHLYGVCEKLGRPLKDILPPSKRRQFMIEHSRALLKLVEIQAYQTGLLGKSLASSGKPSAGITRKMPQRSSYRLHRRQKNVT